MQKCTLRIKNSKLVVRVFVFDTKKEMHQGIRAAGAATSSDTLACVYFGEGNVAAEVYFNRTHLDPGTIAHEFLHATANVMHRRKGDFVQEEEEYARILDELVNKFYKKMK